MNRLVSEVMTGDVLVTRPETTFRELVRLIEDHHVGALPVVDELGRVLGVVAESDLLIKEEQSEGHVRTPLQRRGRARLAGTTAGEVMSSPAVTINQSQRVGQAARVLRRRHIGRLPVVDDDGRLVGIVTRHDLLVIFLRSDEDLLVEVQEAIAAGDDSPPSEIRSITGYHRAGKGDETPSSSVWAGDDSPPKVSATVNEGVAVLQGSAKLLSQLNAVRDRVLRVAGIVSVDVKATADFDDVHIV